LHRLALDMAGLARGDVALACWFSVADVRHFQPWDGAESYFVGPRGSLDVEWKTPWGKLRLWDIQRFYAPVGLGSLREAAKYYGLRKLDMDRANVKRADLSSPKFRRYALNDARITLAIAEKTRAAFARLGVDILVERTAAAASSTVFRSKYLRDDVDPPPPAVRGLAMRCAWGGRAEAFVRGLVKGVREFDYSSAYPRACQSIGEFPGTFDWRPAHSIDDLLVARGGIARVAFDFGEQRYPCLPVATESSLLFPTRGDSYCTAREIQAAQRLGARLELIEGFVFDRGDDGLARYMGAMLQWRIDAGDEAERAVAKLCANALTGKLIQSKGGLEPKRILEKLASLGLKWHEAGQLSDEVWSDLGLDPQPRCGSAWAPEWYALITGFVRGRLAEDIARVQPCYVSTDSLWATDFPNRPDDVSDKGGGNALVLRSRLAILTDGKKTIHAARHSAHRALAPRAYLSLLRGGAAVARYRRPYMPRESLRYGRPLGTFHPVRVKVAAQWDDKRQLLADGSTRPWQSAEDSGL
jgi:hypothetical protein